MITQTADHSASPVAAYPRASLAGALVIGGDYRGLGVVRSLGRRGIPVWVLHDEHRVATASRYALRSLSWRAGSDTQQIEYLLDVASQHRLDGWMLFPSGDETAALIAHYHAALSERFRLTTPHWEAMRFAYDKRLTYGLASKLGIDLPWTRYPTNRQEIESLDCPFPVVLKPAIKEELNSLTSAKAWRVETREELLARYDEACTLVAPDVIMLQEMIPGGGESQYSYAALCKDGLPIASVTARRTRQYPIDFGRASTYVESVDQPEIEPAAQSLLAAIGHTGLFEVEFKRDPRDGRYKLLDINPRVWGWHTLGARAGVDFPFLAWKMIRGEQLTRAHGRPGVRWMRLAMDLPAALKEMRQGNLSPRIYLHSFRGPLEFAIFAADDPLPAMVDLPMLLWMALERGSAHSKHHPVGTGPKGELT